MSVLLLANIAVTAALVGLIWTIQVVHYPLFPKVGAPEWGQYHKSHTVRITFVVAPLMLAELVLTLALAVSPPADALQARLIWWALGLMVVVWISTFGIQVPLHGRLERTTEGHAPDPQVVQMLVRTNWVRTVGWTIKLLLLCSAMLCGAAHAT